MPARRTSTSGAAEPLLRDAPPCRGIQGLSNSPWPCPLIAERHQQQCRKAAEWRAERAVESPSSVHLNWIQTKLKLEAGVVLGTTRDQLSGAHRSWESTQDEFRVSVAVGPVSAVRAQHLNHDLEIPNKRVDSCQQREKQPQSPRNKTIMTPGIKSPKIRQLPIFNAALPRLVWAWHCPRGDCS